MSQAVADSVKHLPRIAVNTTYRLARDAEILYAADEAWWARNPEALTCPGLKVSIEPIPAKLPADGFPDDVLILRNSGRVGFDPRPGYLRTHGNSGAQAVQVAAHAGAARILLCGFDMHGFHWHDEDPKSNFQEGSPRRWIARFRAMAPELAQRGVSVVNCTPGSALDCFQLQPLGVAMEASL